ncbi:16S rRNA (cytidine1402-2'-O)-methyltransferase [Anaerosphaera aminiphila DSM 21120]|uniref:Ribosomal RNA small subunit methyltransferase I n=1 Tax=Anaerosphaera aminiphila DSM 21120 TaxID=1120995 RepID=A0A1M5S4W0_9FIRM|nr:16S rRNA (cytidine(1402)-2'-O)-methyltransferase [Anaerosphaera aminiphila]SHH33509.1 16S rRNA (cytidine1402-2'-O)-methyltransferase [Anaerosphaera aminiphila DSM 21120]
MIYFCPTPIGNLSDITKRTLEVLNSVDIIAAEDTRTSLKLLNNYNIKKKLISYHKFNESSQAENIVELSRENNIAIITDAGLPGISDPGEVLVKKLIEEDIEFQVLPGPNAALTALVLSGLNTEHFLFYGFLNSKSSARKKELTELENLKFTLIFYEAPHRIENFLADLYEIFGDRRISISRELTKLYEQTLRENLSYFVENPGSIKLKGEFVVVVEGKKEEQLNIDVKNILTEKLQSGMKKSQAVKEISKEYNIPKNEVYKVSLEVEE